MTFVDSSSHSESSNPRGRFPMTRIRQLAQKFFSFSFTSHPKRQHEVRHNIGEDTRRIATTRSETVLEQSNFRKDNQRRGAIANLKTVHEQSDRYNGVRRPGCDRNSAPGLNQIDKSYLNLLPIKRSSSDGSKENVIESSVRAPHLDSMENEPEKEQNAIEYALKIQLPPESASIWRGAIDSIEKFLEHRKQLESDRSDPKRIAAVDRLIIKRQMDVCGLFYGAVRALVWRRLIKFAETHKLDEEINAQILLRFTEKLTSESTDLRMIAETQKIDGERLKSLRSLTNLIETLASTHNFESEAIRARPTWQTQQRIKNIKDAFENFLSSLLA